MDYIGVMDFSGYNHIFYMVLDDNEHVSIATFGNTGHSNHLLMWLDFLGRVHNVVLLNAKVVYEGNPTIVPPETKSNWNPPAMIDVK